MFTYIMRVDALYKTAEFVSVFFSFLPFWDARHLDSCLYVVEMHNFLKGNTLNFIISDLYFLVF